MAPVSGIRLDLQNLLRVIGIGGCRPAGERDVPAMHSQSVEES